MTAINEENAFPFEKTLLNTIVKNTKETKVNKIIIISLLDILVVAHD